MTNNASILMVCAAVLGSVVADTTATPSAAAPTAVFEGVWRTVEVVVPSVARPLRPEATLAIFHGRYYSRVEVHAEEPRPALDNAGTASADDLRAVWGSFFAEAGTFEISGSDVVTMHPIVAKNPAAMRDGASSAYTYHRDGDRLTLTQIRTPAGPSAQPITVILARVE